MKRKIFLRPRFSVYQLGQITRIGKAVAAWVNDKGYVKPLPSVEDIAADIGVTTGQLNFYVRFRWRQPVLSWRKGLRIREARRLLLVYPDLAVSVIGEMVGIEDKSNFKRQFTEMVGVSPRAWRDGHLH